MWGLYPQRFLALLEHLVTDGMSADQLADWNEDMRSVADAFDPEDPRIQMMVNMKLASTPAEAAEVMKLGERKQQAIEAGDADKAQTMQERITEINMRAKSA